MKEFLAVCEPSLHGNELKYVTQAVRDTWISAAGTFVERFEQSFAAYCGLDYGVAVCNGTAALHLALHTLEIGKGDEVIIPAFSMISTAFAVHYTGARPVFVDVNPLSWNIEPAKIEAKITKHTKAILPVHIMGLPCDMDDILELASKYKLYVVEDAAQAHGAEYKGRKVGSFSDISCFSFFANKNLTAGEGGICLTNDKVLSERLRYYKDLCFPLHTARDYRHDDIGFNYRMSNLHAAIGLAQTEKADLYRSMRRSNAALYRKYLSHIDGLSFQNDGLKDKLHVHWVNAVVLDPKRLQIGRDELMRRLQDEAIDTRRLFTGMHRQKSLSFLAEAAEHYPCTDNLTFHGLYLPSASHLAKKEIQRVCHIIAAILGQQ